MFTFPPYPPKDYILKDVPRIQRDSPQFTPESGPRVTQTTLGLFCSPVEYKEGEAPEKIEVQPLSPFIVEKWANEARALWVDKPGKDDYFLHNMFKKYNVKFDSYNPAFRHMEKVFNRSYKYELVCLEERRLQKLRDKCEREQSLFEDTFKTVEKKELEESHPPMKVLECKAQPPFWWKNNEEIKVSQDNQISTVRRGRSSAAPNKPPPGRWAKEPCLTAVVVDDPCRRKYDMQLVGQPFKTEACNFYYTNYPPPKITFRPKRST